MYCPRYISADGFDGEMSNFTPAPLVNRFRETCDYAGRRGAFPIDIFSPANPFPGFEIPGRATGPAVTRVVGY